MFDDFIIQIFSLSFTILGQTISCSNLASTVVHLLSLNNIKNELSDIWNIGSTVHTVILPTAYSLLTLFCLIELITKATDPERVTWERMTMVLVKFLFVKAILTNSFRFASMILDICQDIYHNVWQVLNTSGAVPDLGAIMAEVCSGSMSEQMGYFALTILIWILYLSTAFGVITVVFTRVFKIAIYTSVCSIPITMLTNEQSSQNGKRFFMSFASLGLEAVVIMISTVIYGAMLSGLAQSAQGINVVVSVIVINALYLGLMTQANAMAREVTGA